MQSDNNIDKAKDIQDLNKYFVDLLLLLHNGSIVASYCENKKYINAYIIKI